MGKKNLCFDYDKVLKKAVRIEVCEQGHYMTMYFQLPEYVHRGGKVFEFSYRGLVPHEEFPEHVLIIESKHLALFENHFSYDIHEKITALQDELAKPFGEVNLKEKKLIGYYYFPVKNEVTGEFETFHDHYFFDPVRFDGKPLVTEVKTQKNKYSFERTYKTTQKYHSFLIDGLYYEGEGDPLRDMTDGAVEKVKQETVKTLERYSYVSAYQGELEQSIPRYFYKGYMPLKLKGETLRFNKRVGQFFDPYDNRVVVYPAVRDIGDTVSTYEEFLRNGGEVHMNRRAETKVLVYDDELRGSSPSIES